MEQNHKFIKHSHADLRIPPMCQLSAGDSEVNKNIILPLTSSPFNNIRAKYRNK